MTTTAHWFDLYRKPGESLTSACKRFAAGASVSPGSAYLIARGYRVGELVRTKALRYAKRKGLQPQYFDHAPEYNQ